MATITRNVNKRTQRHRRIRAKVKGSAERPRLAFFKSNRYVYAQVIDDVRGATLAAASSREVKGKSMAEQAKVVGEAVAKAALAKKVVQVVFDRGGFSYTGKVKIFADAARAAGLDF
jgi:large subunit ribosomal protein L18